LTHLSLFAKRVFVFEEFCNLIFDLTGSGQVFGLCSSRFLFSMHFGFPADELPEKNIRAEKGTLENMR
jgi:hypothetical protein